MSYKDIQGVILLLKVGLFVDKSGLSTTVRRLTSAVDDRTSSKAVGYLGVIFLGVLSISIVLSDIPLIFSHLKKCFENVFT